MTDEEHRRAIRRRKNYEEDLKLREARFANRMKFDELLQRILKGTIFDLYRKRNSLPHVPLRFEYGH